MLNLMVSDFLSGPAAAHFAAGMGAGLGMIGAAYGISRIAAAAMEGTARQPEAGAAIRTGMIIAAALIEGLGFTALGVCFMLAAVK